LYLPLSLTLLISSNRTAAEAQNACGAPPAALPPGASSEDRHCLLLPSVTVFLPCCVTQRTNLLSGNQDQKPSGGEEAEGGSLSWGLQGTGGNEQQGGGLAAQRGDGTCRLSPDPACSQAGAQARCSCTPCQQHHNCIAKAGWSGERVGGGVHPHGVVVMGAGGALELEPHDWLCARCVGQQ
jgi:hypothetical protein